MYYYQIWIRNIKGLYTWHADAPVPVGARVLVAFRGRKKIGIIVDNASSGIDFKTQPILEVLNETFLAPKYIDLAQNVAQDNFCTLEKVLSLMIPEAFFQQEHPEKRAIFYVLNDEIIPESDIDQCRLQIRGEKQKQVIELLSKGTMREEEVRKIASLATIKNLLEKGLVTQKKGHIIDPFAGQRIGRPHFDFTPLQQKAFDAMQQAIKPVLLFGVTGSGKTELYKKMALQVLEKDASSQVLFLLPEIALTPQLIAEFYGLFGDTVAVWHSRLSEGEKVQEWARLRSGEARILVGTRSALFVPLANPQLIILDEEHEWTYKNEFAPRFWTHDIAQQLSEAFGAKLIFGSATPRLESFYKCQQAEWIRVDLKNRVFQTELPSIEVIDLRNEMKKGNDGPISESLSKRLADMLVQKKQAVFFLNKRGFSGSTLCRVCGHLFHCPNCENNMKLHRKGEQSKFLCHICGHMEKFPSVCPKCGTEKFEFRGWGTQQVEQYLKDHFPGIRVFRADADAITGKYDFQRLMDRFHNYEADVLLGTQMVAKGLDFERVELVGVILADVGLSLPDFRSEERVFQLLHQVAGRAGRRAQKGHIVIQSFRPQERIFSFLKKHDVDGFISVLQEERAQMHYAPFGAVGKLSISHEDKHKAYQIAQEVFKSLKGAMEGDDKEVLFAPAFFPRTHGKYHFHVFVKFPNKESLFEFLVQQKLPPSVKIDIDPISLL